MGVKLEHGDVIAQEAYDEAMDSLTRSQQNELLGNVSMKRAEAKRYKQQVAEGPQAEAKRGFWRTTFRISLLVVAYTLEVMGWLYTKAAEITKELADSV